MRYLGFPSLILCTILLCTACTQLGSEFREENQTFKDAVFPNLNTVPERDDPQIQALFQVKHTEMESKTTLLEHAKKLKEAARRVQEQAQHMT